MGRERLILLGGWQEHPFTHNSLMGEGGCSPGHTLSLPFLSSLKSSQALSLPFLPSPHGSQTWSHGPSDG